MNLPLEDLVKVLGAAAIGAAIGMEREFRDKAAGFRTLIFICVGAALFTLFSAKLAGEKDPTRIAAQIVTGVGFLGAGVILREGGRVIGLTTAAAIWITAALGMGMAGGQYVLSAAVTVIVLVVLWTFQYLERWIDNLRDLRTYEITIRNNIEKFKALEALFHQAGLRILGRRQTKKTGDMLCTWETTGTPGNHDKLVRKLLADDDVKEFHF